MSQIKTNSFRQIILDDLQHIVFGHAVYDNNNTAYSPAVGDNLDPLINYNFSKKYNLIYQNDSFDFACDFTATKKEDTNVLAKVISDHGDKKFMIIDHGRFDTYTLRQFENCQVWNRKYLAPFYNWTHKGNRDPAVIKNNRNHWFTSILGRADVNRSDIFNWIVNNRLSLNNKVSYLCYGSETREINQYDDKQDNFIATGGDPALEKLIPYNNFENKNDIPLDNVGRIRKDMPLYDCLFNIVVETIQTGAYHSEKSLNTILYGHVPIIIGGEGSMKKLQDMGIIIPDYIKWSIWDDLPVQELNLSKIDVIKRQLKKLFSETTINDIANDWHPYAVKNLKHFNNLEKMCAEEEKEICRWILTATHNISNTKYQRLYN